MDRLLQNIIPNIVLVQGDTTTVFTSALAAYYQKIDVGHVEAGLRSFDKYDPFPEELNRKMVSSIASLHFAPTVLGKDNLINEGINEKDIFVTGNTVIDALYLILKRKWANHLKQVNWKKKVILVTVHRRESFKKGLSQIADALKSIAKNNKEVEIVFPIHPNPNVRRIMEKKLTKIENIKMSEPFDYPTFVNVMKRSTLILTDSGGIQEEAPYFGVPVLVMREVTERLEAVQAGCVKVVGTVKETIIKEAEILLKDKAAYEKMARSVNPYGDGKAARRIVSTILDKYENKIKNDL